MKKLLAVAFLVLLMSPLSPVSAEIIELKYSTYLGTEFEEGEYGPAIAIDSLGSAYLTGSTRSLFDFPVVNPYQSAEDTGIPNVFVSKFSPSGSALEYSTYLGGSSYSAGLDLAVDSQGRAWVAGFTACDNFPVVNPYQAVNAGGQDGFVSRFSTSGSSLEFSTYLGGAAGSNSGEGIAIDAGGEIWLTGSTVSPYFPTVNPYQATHSGNTDAFIARFSPGLTTLLFSSFLGGASIDEGRDVAYGGGSICVAGVTRSINFPTKNAYQASRTGIDLNDDIFLTKFSPANNWGYDYNGDGTSDIAIFRSSSGLWAIRRITRVYFGQNGDIPSPGDYDGSGTTEIAILRPSSGLWAIRGVSRIYFGSSNDTPLPGDYDGDGNWEPAVFRENTGLWAIRGLTRVYFGQFGDTPIPGYYSGSGQSEIALFRVNSGLWAIRDFSRFYFGGAPDEPVPGNYDGGDSWSAGIFRPQSGLWAIRGITRVYFGQDLDGGYPADYRGDGEDGIAIFRPSSGLWAIRGLTRVYFGQYGDAPVTR